MYLPAMDIVEIYFDKNLGLATGIASAGSGFGQFIMAPAIHIVKEQLGLEGTFYILGGVVSTAVFFGLIYRIPKTKSSNMGIDNLAYQFDKEQKKNVTMVEKIKMIQNLNSQRMRILKGKKVNMY